MLVMVAAFVGCEEAPVDEPSKRIERPHLVLMVADTLRQSYLGTYGFAGEISPAIDRLALQSVVFEHAIAPAPWTRPSIASILTSLPPEVHGLTANGKLGHAQALNERVPTLADELRKAGYETVALYANGWLHPRSGLGRGFERYEKVAGGAIEIVAKALEVLADRPTNRPVFLYLHFMDTHGPYRCPEEVYARIRRSDSLGEDRRMSAEERKNLGYLRRTKTPWLADPEQRETQAFWRSCYGANVSLFDKSVEPLVAALLSGARANDTVAVFTSDHGEALGEHPISESNRRRWEHGWSLHFHQLRVPLLVRLPGGRHGGLRLTAAVSVSDVAPTMLELVGLAQPEAMYGQSFLCHLPAGSCPLETYVFSTGVKRVPGLQAVQDERFKLILDSGPAPVALYDLAEDPSETRDVAEHWPEVVRNMREAARERRRKLHALAQPPISATAHAPGVVDELRALGYIDE